MLLCGYNSIQLKKPMQRTECSASLVLSSFAARCRAELCIGPKDGGVGNRPRVKVMAGNGVRMHK